jgi:hypothetical protein
VIWIDGQGTIEGGVTNTIALSRERLTNRDLIRTGTR